MIEVEEPFSSSHKWEEGPEARITGTGRISSGPSMPGGSESG